MAIDVMQGIDVMAPLAVTDKVWIIGKIAWISGIGVMAVLAHIGHKALVSEVVEPIRSPIEENGFAILPITYKVAPLIVGIVGRGMPSISRSRRCLSRIPI